MSVNSSHHHHLIIIIMEVLISIHDVFQPNFISCQQSCLKSLVQKVSLFLEPFRVFHSFGICKFASLSLHSICRRPLREGGARTKYINHSKKKRTIFMKKLDTILSNHSKKKERKKTKQRRSHDTRLSTCNQCGQQQVTRILLIYIWIFMKFPS